MILRKMGKFLAVLVIAGLIFVPAEGVNAAQKPQSLLITTGTTGGTYYPMGVGMAVLWSKKLEEQKIRVAAQSSAGSGENMIMLKDKETDLSILQGLFGAMAWDGTGIYKDKPYKELRTICMCWPNVEHFVIMTDKVKTGTVMDIKGLRFSIGRAGSGTERSGLTIMEGLGLKREDVQAEYLGYFESSTAMKDGRIAGANLPAGPPVAAVTDLFASPGMKVTILEITDEQLEAINKRFPTWFRYAVPANTYPGQGKPVRTIAQPNFLGVRMDVNPDTVYLLTKTLMENTEEMKKFHAMGAFIKLETAINGLPAPLHPGAWRYYKEKNVKIPPSLIPPEAK